MEPRPVVSTSGALEAYSHPVVYSCFVTGSGSIDAVIESFSASNIDDALDLMEVVNAKTDKASVGAMAGGLERHPEVCIEQKGRFVLKPLSSAGSRLPLKHIWNENYQN